MVVLPSSVIIMVWCISVGLETSIYIIIIGGRVGRTNCLLIEIVFFVLVFAGLLMYICFGYFSLNRRSIIIS